MKGLDYSSGRPFLSAVKKAGYGFVIRYLFAPMPGGKGVSKTEATAIRAAGLGLCVVYEEYAGRAKEGTASGVADGRVALAFARAIGFPESKPIYFAVDFQATTAQLSVVDLYLKGVASVIGLARVGVYGSCSVIEHCQAVQSARWYWQTYAWSGGKVSPHAHLLQYLNGQVIAGASVDLNESRQLNFGAWMPDVKPVIIPPKPPVVKPAVKPAIHIMTPSEMLAWMKSLFGK